MSTILMFVNDGTLHSDSGITKTSVEEAFKITSEWQAVGSTKCRCSAPQKEKVVKCQHTMERSRPGAQGYGS